MANLNISDLRPTGYELFSGTESYMIELSDEINIWGGSVQNTGSLFCTIVNPDGQFTTSSATIHTPYPHDSFGGDK